MNQIYQPEYSRHCDRLAKRAGERPLLNYSTMEMTYEEWLKLAEDSYNTDTGARCTETFAALAEKTCGLPSDMDERPKVRQPGIRVLPFTHSIFKSICDSFQVHGRFINAWRDRTRWAQRRIVHVLCILLQLFLRKKYRHFLRTVSRRP
jgi:hypothetical protein